MPETARSSTTTVPWGGATSVRCLWIASVRGFATRVWIRVTSRRGRFPAGRGGCCPVRRSGPTRRDNVPEAVRSALRALFRCRGLGTGSPVDSTARALMPRSTPTVASGRAGALSWRATSTVNAQYQRPASRRTVADRIRAVRGLQAAGQFAGRLVRLDRADPGQGSPAYGRVSGADHPGGEPH